MDTKNNGGQCQSGAGPGASLRDLKCTLPGEEFGAVQWAAKRAGHLAAPPQRALPLADFLRLAVLEQVRAIVRGEIARGHAIPPDVAAAADAKRGNLRTMP
jgi:hypothetical protein